jgi:hypothetical protein
LDWAAAGSTEARNTIHMQVITRFMQNNLLRSGILACASCLPSIQVDGKEGHLGIVRRVTKFAAGLGLKAQGLQKIFRAIQALSRKP